MDSFVVLICTSLNPPVAGESISPWRLRRFFEIGLDPPVTGDPQLTVMTHIWTSSRPVYPYRPPRRAAVRRTPEPRPVAKPAVGSRFALPILLAGTCLIVLDFFIVNVAMPSIQTELHASSAALEWVVAGYG